MDGLRLNQMMLLCLVSLDLTIPISTVHVSFNFHPNYTNCSTYKGRICDEQGNDIPLDAQPPLRPSDRGPADWTPYTDQVRFEVADFLYRHNQMSGGDIDFIFGLWAASLAPHSDTPPFANHVDMYDAIDSTPLGDVPWQSF